MEQVKLIRMISRNNGRVGASGDDSSLLPSERRYETQDERKSNIALRPWNLGHCGCGSESRNHSLSRALQVE